jgi:hypothetical protein
MDNVYLLNTRVTNNTNNTNNINNINNTILKINNTLRRHNNKLIKKIKPKHSNSKNKEFFRLLSNKCNDYMRQITIPNIQLNMPYEAVLIEFRNFPHIEFLIRNTILKLGVNWSYTVICGNENYESVKSICDSIHPNIKIIKTKFNQLIPSTYNIFLTSLEFWNLLVGEKILIYQEDSCIFKDNINHFLQYDYVGAPWPNTQNDNKYCVGNGGFSLRTKQHMIDVINKISLNNTKFSSSTIDYMRSNNLTVAPEDVYFSLNMIKYNIGNVAPYNIAKAFSTETIVNINSLGGHNFWLNDPFWRRRVTNLVPTFTPNFNKAELLHRGGWNHVLDDGLIKNKFYNKASKLDFFDMIDLNIDQIIASSSKGRSWAGIFHFTPKTPAFLNGLNINSFFKNEKFVSAFKKCIFIVTLCDYLHNHLIKVFKKLNINTPIYTIKHPVVMDVPRFNMSKYLNNTNKQFIQVGKQLRKITSIYMLPNIAKHQKMWLTGTSDYKLCHKLIEDELKFLNISHYQINLKKVKMLYTSTFAEYDDYLSKNIVFIDLWDATANNAVLECICRNTPIIVNKVPGVIDYLGENYPLYFNELEEVPNLITEDKILEAHDYLKQMDKTDIHLDHFIKELFNIAYKHNPN